MQFQKIFSPGLIGDSLALIAGALLTLAFAPFDIFPLAVISLAILLALWLKVSKQRAFFRGFLFGVGLFSTGVYWIYISVHTFGNTSALFALLITGLLIAVLSLFPALVGYFLNRFFPNNKRTKLLCAFPALWVFFEWIRSWIFSGFPWLFLGYTQINSPLKGYASIYSVYGVSLAVTISAALFLNIMIRAYRKEYREMYFSIFIIALFWMIGGILSFISWTKPEGSDIKISLVQGNIPQSLKWEPEQVMPTLDLYKKLSSEHWDSKIIIWPESAIPMIMQQAGSFLEEMTTLARKHQTTIITGVPVESPDQPRSYFNSVITLGEGSGTYSKQRLVPFGEFIPMQKMFKKLFDILQIPMSDFVPGPDASDPIIVDKLKIATFICYEIAFPEQVRSRDGNIGAILTVSNDAWFGHSIAQAQHLEMGQMRAIEMGRPVLFVSNDGITAFIDHTGKIISAAPQYQTYVLTDSIKAYTGKTPWQRIGMDPILIIMMGLIIVAIRGRNGR